MLILKSRSQIHKVIEHYLETNFKDFIKYSQDKTNIGTPVDNYKIWVCWLQGKDNMPEVVKLCYDNLLNKIKDKEIVLITFENLKNYVEIPDYIYKKYQEGKILPAHFSDIVRCALLSKYGGMWIDSTIFVTDNIKQHLDIFESEITKAVLNIVPVIKERLPEINKFIDEQEFLSDVRKTFYKTMLAARYYFLLEPAWGICTRRNFSRSASERLKNGIPYTEALFEQDYHEMQSDDWTKE